MVPNMSANLELSRSALGANIALALRERDCSPYWLADKLGVSIQTVNRYLDGTTEPSFRQVVHIGLLLAYPVGWFERDRRGEA